MCIRDREIPGPRRGGRTGGEPCVHGQHRNTLSGSGRATTVPGGRPVAGGVLQGQRGPIGPRRLGGRMEIKVLGAGCAKCANTKKLIADVAAELGVEVDIEPVTDLMEITKYDVMSTPGVVIDLSLIHISEPTRLGMISY